MLADKGKVVRSVGRCRKVAIHHSRHIGDQGLKFRLAGLELCFDVFAIANVFVDCGNSLGVSFVGSKNIKLIPGVDRRSTDFCVNRFPRKRYATTQLKPLRFKIGTNRARPLAVERLSSECLSGKWLSGEWLSDHPRCSGVYLYILNINWAIVGVEDHITKNEPF